MNTATHSEVQALHASAYCDGDQSPQNATDKDVTTPAFKLA